MTGERVLREWLSLLAGVGKAPTKLEKSLRATDVLVVVDMQNDMVTGAARVPEAQEVERAVVSIMQKANAIGCKIIAVRSLHPANHKNFSSEKGEHGFPPYCLSGTTGSFFTIPIGDALTEALQVCSQKKEKNVHICTKGFREDVRCFGAFPYSAKLATRRLGMNDVTQLDETFLEWTGSFELKSSCMERNVNAPPDLRAVMDRTPITELLWGMGENTRVFICGLPLDFGVIDTACCANVAGKAPYIIVDATRPVSSDAGAEGSTESAFVSSIDEHAKLLGSYKVRLCYTSDVLAK